MKESKKQKNIGVRHRPRDKPFTRIFPFLQFFEAIVKEKNGALSHRGRELGLMYEEVTKLE